MPIYEYQCQNCGHLFEELQSMKEAPLVTCPKCGKNELKKLIGSGGIIFKGSGFYQTDYKKSGSKKENIDTTSSPVIETKPAKTESKSKSKKESKSEKKK
jgi:putative FmdB family regulatory protein